jgi:hypothetical protein
VSVPSQNLDFSHHICVSVPSQNLDFSHHICVCTKPEPGF